MATAYPGGLRKRGGLLDEFMAPDYSYLARRAELTPKQREYAANAPIDFLRGTFAGLLGAPADVANIPQSPMPMEQFGEYSYAPAQKIPYGSEYFLKNLPLAPAEDNPLGRVAGQVGSFAPMVPVQAARMAGKGVAATGWFVAPKAGQLAERYMVNTGAILPLDVYHGTPHTLPPTPRNPLGEFDASKIGTGEGAQAYGYGTYVAESPAVAKGYQESLSKRQFLTKDGFFDPSELEHLNVKVTAGRGDLDKAIELARKYGSPDSDYPDAAARAARDLQKLEALKAAGGIKQNTGNLYKIDLPDEKIAQMLDFDKPLSQQKNILNALTPENMGLTLRPTAEGKYMAYLADGKPIGLQVKGVTPEVFREKWISRLREMGDLEGGAGRAVGYLGGTVPGDLPPLVAKALRQAGIPGIKYLDEGSRSAGKGTRNFVVFPGEEKSMTILERNAQRAEELKRLQAGGLLAP